MASTGWCTTRHTATHRPTRRYHRAKSAIRFSSRTDFRELTTTSGSITQIKHIAIGWLGAFRLPRVNTSGLDSLARYFNVNKAWLNSTSTHFLSFCSARSASEPFSVREEWQDCAHHVEPAIAGQLYVVQVEDPRSLRLPVFQQDDCDRRRLVPVPDERLDARRHISNPSVHNLRRQRVGCLHKQKLHDEWVANFDSGNSPQC